ncbi:hypothetical protein L484_006124 [Morus notabilis]|uniref:Uncharacterized protein n=1 Tax=Morus notabilis TaxID=981085 RepID=W9S7B6_9ROSA|nr:hypothetical protein L484_006124 [Morus notabilis]
MILLSLSVANRCEPASGEIYSRTSSSVFVFVLLMGGETIREDEERRENEVAGLVFMLLT